MTGTKTLNHEVPHDVPRPFKTLIVEDNPSFRQVLKEILRRRFSNMSVQEAVDGVEALEKVDAFLPDLIFMDIRLPGENGLELTRKIKQKFPRMTIAVLTSYDLPEYREAALLYGANYFLPKSSSTEEEIVALVQSITPGNA